MNNMRISFILITIIFMNSCGDKNGEEKSYSKEKEKNKTDRNIIEKHTIPNEIFQSIDEKELDQIAKKFLYDDGLTVDFGAPIEIVYQEKYKRYLIIYKPDEKIIQGMPPNYVLIDAKTKKAECVPFDMQFSEDKKEVIGISNFKLIDEKEAIKIANNFIIAEKRSDWTTIKSVRYQSAYHRYLIIYITPKEAGWEGRDRGVFVDSLTKKPFFLQ